MHKLHQDNARRPAVEALGRQEAAAYRPSAAEAVAVPQAAAGTSLLPGAERHRPGVGTWAGVRLPLVELLQEVARRIALAVAEGSREEAPRVAVAGSTADSAVAGSHRHLAADLAACIRTPG